MDPEKNKHYRIRVKEHRLTSIVGKTLLARFNGVCFSVNWGITPMIIDKSKVEVLSEVDGRGKAKYE